MAKIRITGGEWLDVPNEELKLFIEKRKKNEILLKNIVEIGSWGGFASEIRGWILDEELRENQLEFYREYYEQREKRLNLIPEERVKEGVLEYFRFFYRGIFDNNPSQELETKVVEKSIEFFKKNPEWSRPSIKVFADLFQGSLRIKKQWGIILQRCENNELQDIKKRKEFLAEGITKEIIEKKYDTEKDMEKTFENINF